MLSRQQEGCYRFGPKARQDLEDGSQASRGAGPARVTPSILPPIGGSEREARWELIQGLPTNPAA